MEFRGSGVGELVVQEVRSLRGLLLSARSARLSWFLKNLKEIRNVNILNSSLEQIVGLVLACGLGSSLSGCLPEVGDLCSGLF